MNLEEIKNQNLADILSANYGLKFRRSGQGYVCRSPFTEDRNPSFHVRLVDCHWLFKDFSSGHGGSIIDFIRLAEGISGFPKLIRRAKQLCDCQDLRPIRKIGDPRKRTISKKRYDIDSLFRRFSQNSVTKPRQYLLGRGIDRGLVDAMIDGRAVAYNRYRGKDYACFVVRDAGGSLRCLENHEIGGRHKFTLGSKLVYTMDWQVLSGSEVIFICEGIIDYLSIKTLEGPESHGLALTGNQLIFGKDLLSGCSRIVSALDDDEGGRIALSALGRMYPEKDIIPYDLGGHKDPNALLQSKNEMAA
ncbi:hypothetical protein DESC_520023 [Desulfosarcina cetonica]|uniref:CHC2 zinc finger domain-containing protein n=1 Tax=Desulfosarcina cetonica TaxID=90730 RepID=UPI0006CF66A1|nr:CHC2 zinc finger domain-containing protein [Desulfosarcina cetonica]VTR66880.1 hypothetical protein DESC_520023 [Desulfosarcina cetonica]